MLSAWRAKQLAAKTPYARHGSKAGWHGASAQHASAIFIHIHDVFLLPPHSSQWMFLDTLCFRHGVRSSWQQRRPTPDMAARRAGMAHPRNTLQLAVINDCSSSFSSTPPLPPRGAIVTYSVCCMERLPGRQPHLAVPIPSNPPTKWMARLRACSPLLASVFSSLLCLIV